MQDLIEMVTTTELVPYYGNILKDATIAELPNHYRGKVRDNYDLGDGRRIIIATDRLSAFDKILTAIPLKGQVLTQLARFWFEATRDICPNHVIDYPDPNVLVCRRLDILPVEIVVRDYLAGTTSTSILSMYRAGRREMYGTTLPDGIRDNQPRDRQTARSHPRRYEIRVRLRQGRPHHPRRRDPHPGQQSLLVPREL